MIYHHRQFESTVVMSSKVLAMTEYSFTFSLFWKLLTLLERDFVVFLHLNTHFYLKNSFIFEVMLWKFTSSKKRLMLRRFAAFSTHKCWETRPLTIERRLLNIVLGHASYKKWFYNIYCPQVRTWRNLRKNSLAPHTAQNLACCWTNHNNRRGVA